jgi:glycosyltransferase involved in cell wall biosynthesis
LQMMEKQRFSFIIPVLNGEDYIGKCLESINREMNPACDEIIVVDNGSSDGTIAIVNKYQDIKLLVHPKITIAAMRNAGAKLAQGEYFAFIDSDCTINPGWRNSVLDVFKDGRVGASGSHYEIPDDSNWIVKAWSSNKVTNRTIVKWINTCNLIISREAFEKIGGFNEKLTTDEDFDIGLRIDEMGYQLVEDPRIGVVHYKNPDTIGAFYRRERWYATSMLSGAVDKRFDKPLVMSLLFLLSVFAFFALFIFAPNDFWYAGACLLIVFLILILTVINRIIRYRNFKYIPHLGILYLVYYIAKINTILAFVGRKIGIISR